MSSCRIPKYFLLVSAVITWSLTTIAGVENFAPLPAVISGTLDPLTIAINGQVLLVRETAAKKIFINQTPVKASNEEHFPFYESTDEIVIEISEENTVIQKWNLPIIKDVRVSGNELIAAVSSDAHQILFDNQPKPVENKKAVLLDQIHDSRDPWYTQNHEIHVIDPQTSLERWYLLEMRPDPPRQSMSRVGLGVCSASASEDNALCLNYDYIWSNHVVAGVTLNVQPFQKTSRNSTTGWAVGLRGGWQVFRQDHQPGSPVWFETGLNVIQTEAESHYDTGAGWENNQKIHSTGIFIYVLTEPIRIKQFSMQFMLMGGPRSHQSVHNVNQTLSLVYTW